MRPFIGFRFLSVSFEVAIVGRDRAWLLTSEGWWAAKTRYPPFHAKVSRSETLA